MTYRPLITCLMLTTPQRFAYLRQSVADYCWQTYEPRELLIISNRGQPDDYAALDEYIASLGRSDIRHITVEGRPSLGPLRNISVAATQSDVLCQWDDDDRHHPDRIEQQFRALMESGRDAVILQRCMQYYLHTRTMYCLNWHATEPKGFPGTIMFRRTARMRYPEEEPLASFGEDTAVLAQLHAQDAVTALADSPHLYIYISHGGNTWPDAHHMMLSERLAISRGLLLRHEAELRRELAVFDLGPELIAVQG